MTMVHGVSALIFSQEKAAELIQQSGDEVRLTLSRPRKGYIKAGGSEDG